MSSRGSYMPAMTSLGGREMRSTQASLLSARASMTWKSRPISLL